MNLTNTDESMGSGFKGIKGQYGHFCPKFSKPFEVDLRIEAGLASRKNWSRDKGKIG